jgi:hypothetical protein
MRKKGRARFTGLAQHPKVPTGAIEIVLITIDINQANKGA